MAINQQRRLSDDACVSSTNNRNCTSHSDVSESDVRKKSTGSIDSTDFLPSSPRTPLEETHSVAATAIESLSLSSFSKQNKKLVSFSSRVQVREHNVIFGSDNVLYGFPISLDWKHAPEIVVDIDHYGHTQQSNSSKRGAGPFPRALAVEERQCRLRNMGYTTAALRQHETQRKICLTFNWAYGHSVGAKTPPLMSKDDTIYCVQNYIM